MVAIERTKEQMVTGVKKDRRTDRWSDGYTVGTVRGTSTYLARYLVLVPTTSMHGGTHGRMEGGTLALINTNSSTYWYRGSHVEATVF